MISLLRTACLLTAAVLLCQPPSALAAPKTAPSVSHTVKVSNGRSSPVTALSFAPQGAETTGSNVLKTPLPAGKSIAVVVKGAKGQCLFDVSGSYEDESEISASGIDLCKDKKLALVD